MQTNSPPKLDTTKHTCIFHYHKQSKYLPLKVYKLKSPLQNNAHKTNLILTTIHQLQV